MTKVKLFVMAFATAMVCAFMLGCASAPASSSAASDASGSSASAASASASAEASSSASAASASASAASTLADGTYNANFNTDSSMFHVNEADEGLGLLTVQDGEMTIHVRLVSKKIVNLYVGMAEQAEQDSANVLEPVAETVTYSDGYQEEVYAFDIPVPVLDEEYDVAILGEKGKWYDHKVSVTDPAAA